MFKFATILFIQILCGMEMDLFIPSFPELQKVFNLSPVMVQLTIGVNFVAFCICSLFAGALGDKYNRRTVLIGGLLIFVLGSVVCVTAQNFPVLILGRVFQGIGISAPAILSFPVLLEDYSVDKQPGIVGMINGAKTLAMAIAPVIGSFVNLYFNWRANFSLLLGLGIICFIASYFSIPHKMGNKSVSLSLKTYLPLLQSKRFMSCMIGLSFLTAAYWLFAAMAPILYMNDMGVPLKNFGYYQGSLSLTFAIICIFSPKVFAWYGHKKCLYFGLGLCFISIILLVGLIIIETRDPLIVTAVLILFSIAVVFPINILYPLSLEIVPHTKGRSAGLGQTMLLLLTASLIETVSYFYNGWFMPIGLAMVLSILISLVLVQAIIYKKWLHLDN